MAVLLFIRFPGKGLDARPDASKQQDGWLAGGP